MTPHALLRANRRLRGAILSSLFLSASVGSGLAAAHAQGTFTEVPFELSNGNFFDAYGEGGLSGTGATLGATELTLDPTGTFVTDAQAVTLASGSSTPTELGFLPGNNYSIGYGISNDGSKVVGTSVTYDGSSSFTSPAQATEWTASGGSASATGLGFLAGYTDTTATSVSDTGNTVMGIASNDDGTSQVFRWTSGGGITNLGTLPGGYADSTVTSAFGSSLSSDGTSLAGTLTSNDGSLPNEAFQWSTSTGMTAIGFLSGGTFSNSVGISRDGSTVVGYGNNGNPNANGNEESFRWTKSGGLIGLGLAYGDFSNVAFSSSGDAGLVVGDYYPDAADGVESAFLYRNSYGFADVKDYLEQDPSFDSTDLAGWTLQDALSVSPNGKTIIGDGTDPSGNFAYWVASDPNGFTAGYTPSAGLLASLGQYSQGLPEPGSITLLLAAGMFLTPTVLRGSLAARRSRVK